MTRMSTAHHVMEHWRGDERLDRRVTEWGDIWWTAWRIEEGDHVLVDGRGFTFVEDTQVVGCIFDGSTTVPYVWVGGAA